jgi:hypothetical protein
MYELAKKARDERKAKARRLANPGTLDKDQDTTSATWSPAEPLNADVKTGARPVGKGARLYNKGGKVAAGKSAARADRKRRATGGRAMEKEISNGIANKDVRAANEERDGKKHIGAFKKGGAAFKDAGILDKKAVGDVQVKPVRGKAQNYKKGGRIKKEGGGWIDNIANALAGKGYIDGSTWMSKEEEARSSDSAPTPPRRPANLAASRRRAAPIKRVADPQYPLADRTIAGAESPMASDRFMKKGGRTKKQVGGADGSFLQRMVGGGEKEKREREMRDVGKGRTSSYSPEDKSSMEEIVKGRSGSGLPETEEIFESTSRVQGRKKGGRTARKAGGRAKSKPSIVVKIETGKQAPAMGGVGAVPPLPPVPPMPPVPPAAGAPMGPGPMPPIPGMGAGPIGRKAGGRITKVAKSYKDMEAGAASGEGRLQKTDIESRHTDAPARKSGGRISKVAKSYKDMTAGAESGEGRLQKMDIAKAKKARSK